MYCIINRKHKIKEWILSNYLLNSYKKHCFNVRKRFILALSLLRVTCCKTDQTLAHSHLTSGEKLLEGCSYTLHNFCPDRVIPEFLETASIYYAKLWNGNFTLLYQTAIHVRYHNLQILNRKSEKIFKYQPCKVHYKYKNVVQLVKELTQIASANNF